MLYGIVQEVGVVNNMRCIDGDALYKQMTELEELARNRVLDTEPVLPYQNNLNPSYTRYLAQMDERTKLKELVADAPTIEPEWKNCVTCRYNVLQWDAEPCDGCTGDRWKPIIRSEQK